MGKRRTVGFAVAAVALAVLVGGGLWVRSGLLPGPARNIVLVRFPKATALGTALDELGRKGVANNPLALRFVARVMRRDSLVPTGTYRFRPDDDGIKILEALERPIRQMVRIPETNWARRTSRVLEQAEVCEADEYMDLVHRPQEFQTLVDFPLPKDSLEGYLFPDTYDLPPLMGARAVIERQLLTFKRKVWDGLKQPANLHRAVIVASMVELEVMKHEERPVVAGVIENRTQKGMRLQIDATINYALQKWRPLRLRDYREVVHPYNTYLNDGLPPGPICSPSLRSIEAALKPARHPYLYYVAMPDGHHLFSTTLDEHRANVAKRRKALAEAGR